jgi:hypothetical protein
LAKRSAKPQRRNFTIDAFESPTANNLYIYDPSVSSSVSPTATKQDGRSITTGALIEAS